MTSSPMATYHRLIITASLPGTEIWLGDDEGHFVQRAVGELDTSLMPGDYVVEFGLGALTYSVQLPAPTKYTQDQLEAGPPCQRPVPRFDAEQ